MSGPIQPDPLDTTIDFILDAANSVKDEAEFCLIIIGNKKDYEYYISGLDCFEAVAALEITKHSIISGE